MSARADRERERRELQPRPSLRVPYHARAAPARLLDGQRVYMSGRAHSGVEGRQTDFVTSHGGVVVEAHQNPTMAIFADNHAGGLTNANLKRVMREYRIVRERWLLRLEGLTELPDFRPDAVYARVRDVRTPGSYFHGAADRDVSNAQDDHWTPIREDWTPSA